MIQSSWVRAVGPASISNLGPGFDSLGLCIDTHHDVVAVSHTGEEGVQIDEIVGLDAIIPFEAGRNTASIAASAVLRASGKGGGLRLRIQKGIPLGSGIGGSAASAVAGAMAAAAALGLSPDGPEIIEAALAGEAAASGARHGDNVLPAFLGGFVATTPADPMHYQRIRVDARLSLALVLPSTTILTKSARSILPPDVPFESAVRNAAAAARIVASVVNEDWKALGENIMMDEIVEPMRARLVPGFGEARKAALEAGAYGAALSGSGPAIFAVCANDDHARRVAGAMADALARVGVDSAIFVAHPSNKGAFIEEE
ncbi:MAG: homoserine kinase [Rhodothermia bacterium]